MKQRSGSSSLSALKLKSFSSLVKWCAAHYTRHMKCHVSLRDLTGCVWTHAQIPENHRQCEWTKIKRSRDDSRNTLPVYFPESLCERGLCESLERSLNRFVQTTDSFRNWKSDFCWIWRSILLLLFLTLFFYGRNRSFMWFLIQNLYINHWFVKKCWLIQKLKFLNIFIGKGKTKYGCTIYSILIRISLFSVSFD